MFKAQYRSFDSSVNQGAELLAEYFHESVGNSMVNTARSALSSAFPAKNGTSLASTPFMRGYEEVCLSKDHLSHVTQ